MNLQELLKGTEFLKDGEIVAVQSIKNMEVAFLTCPDEFSFDRFGDPRKVIVSNQRYGHLRIKNDTQEDIVVMPQTAWMSKGYHAQNHALPKSAVIRAGKSQDFNDAGCIEGGQGGHINASRQNEMRFMPVSVRDALLERANHTGSYSHLYSIVQDVGRRTATRTGDYLNVYYDTKAQELDEFIAHFELPERVIGTVVFVDGEILAIDKFPSFRYTKQIWAELIRDCYASVAIESQVKSQTDFIPERFEDFLELERQNSNDGISSIQNALNRLYVAKNERLVARMEEILDLEFEKTPEPDSTDNVYESYILRTDGYIGQVISSGEFHVAVSLAKEGKFDSSALRERAKVRSEYSRAAQRQRDFTL